LGNLASGQDAGKLFPVIGYSGGLESGKGRVNVLLKNICGRFSK
jgi:hypothetical protein